jgi:hypothetical protein
MAVWEVSPHSHTVVCANLSTCYVTEEPITHHAFDMQEGCGSQEEVRAYQQVGPDKCYSDVEIGSTA